MVCERLLNYLKPCGGYAMDKPDYEKSFLKSIESKCRYKLKEDGFLAILSRCGLTATREGDRVFFTNDRYPGMFKALDEWKNLMAPYRKGAVKYKYDAAFRSLGYRIFLPDYKITFESSKWYMSDEVIHFLTEIINTLAELGLKITKADNTHSIALGCDYKGEHLVWYNFIDNFHNACHAFRTGMFKTGSPEMAVFEQEVNKLPNAGEIKSFCLKGINRCQKCGCHPVPPSQLGRWAEVFGKRVNLCGGRNCFETRNFDEKSLDIMKTLIKLNYRIITQTGRT